MQEGNLERLEELAGHQGAAAEDAPLASHNQQQLRDQQGHREQDHLQGKETPRKRVAGGAQETVRAGEPRNLSHSPARGQEGAGGDQQGHREQEPPRNLSHSPARGQEGAGGACETLRTGEAALTGREQNWIHIIPRQWLPQYLPPNPLLHRQPEDVENTK